MKIETFKRFRTPHAYHDPSVKSPPLNKKKDIGKDQFHKATAAYTSNLSGHRQLFSSSRAIDAMGFYKVNNPWWNDDLIKLLPPLPKEFASMTGDKEQAKLFDILKTIAHDKSHLILTLV